MNVPQIKVLRKFLRINYLEYEYRFPFDKKYWKYSARWRLLHTKKSKKSSCTTTENSLNLYSQMLITTRYQIEVEIATTQRTKSWAHSSVGRVLESHSRGREFDSPWVHNSRF